MSEPLPVWGIVLIFIAAVGGFAAFWCLITALIGRISGWAKLASVYQYGGLLELRRVWRYQSAGFGRFANYGNCLTVGVDEAGLHLATVILFRCGHRALLIPWSDLTVRRRKMLFVSRIELRFAAVPSVVMTISDRLAQRIAETAGDQWPAAE